MGASATAWGILLLGIISAAQSLPSSSGSGAAVRAAGCTEVDCGDMKSKLVPDNEDLCTQGYYCNCQSGAPVLAQCGKVFLINTQKIFNPNDQDCVTPIPFFKQCATWLKTTTLAPPVTEGTIQPTEPASAGTSDPPAPSAGTSGSPASSAGTTSRPTLPPTQPPAGTTRSPTDAPPTARPPTGAPPTARPPTGAPPTARPPTGAPPTSRPPTGAPPTSRPPTDAPPRPITTANPNAAGRRGASLAIVLVSLAMIVF